MGPNVALLLDLDGVLIDSWPVAQRAIERAFADVSAIGAPPVDAFRALRGQPLPEIAAQLHLPSTFVDGFRRYSLEMAGTIAPFPGIETALRHMRSAGICLGVVTGKDHKRTIDVLARVGLTDLLDAVVTADDAPGKPSPEALFTCIRRMPSTTPLGYVGDTPCDMETARNAGLHAILATWDADASGHGDSVVTTPDELARLAMKLREQILWSG